MLRGCGRGRAMVQPESRSDVQEPSAIPPTRPEVLLIRRGREPMAGSWSLPGGAIELGETTAEACAREVLEETGLAVEVIAPVETVDIIVRDEAGRVRFHYLVVDMVCHPMDPENQSTLQAGADADAAVWASTQEVLEAGAFSLTPRACTVIRKAVEQFSCGARATPVARAGSGASRCSRFLRAACVGGSAEDTPGTVSRAHSEQLCSDLRGPRALLRSGAAHPRRRDSTGAGTWVGGPG